MAKTKYPVTVLAAKLWREKHKDYRGKGADGVKRILFMSPTTGATESWPVEEVARYMLAHPEVK